METSNRKPLLSDQKEWATLDLIIEILGRFNKARNGRVPYDAKAPCPACKVADAFISFSYRGPRAARMVCDNPECRVKLLS